MKTIGELYDALKEIERQEADLDRMVEMVARGNCHPDTTARRQQAVDAQLAWVHILRNEPLNPLEKDA